MLSLSKKNLNESVTAYVEGFSVDSSRLITNVVTSLNTLNIDGFQLPTTLNSAECDNAYVCSPYTALVSYGLEELSKLDSTHLEFIGRVLLPLLGGYIRRREINKILHINNWMLSTNLYPEYCKGESLFSQLGILTKEYSDYAIVLRSLNKLTNNELLIRLSKAGFILVPSRQVYIFSPSLNNIEKTHNYQIDSRLLSKTGYHYTPQGEIADEDIPRIVELYNMLYITKYSTYNPVFTEEYIRLILQNNAFSLYGFRNREGILDAVGGRFTIDRVTSLPIVGYDTRLPIELGLYRLVLIKTIRWALDNGLTFHASSGAPHYKRLRGAVPAIEYSAVYANHLSPARRRMWKLLAVLLSKLLVPMMQRYEL